MRQPIFFLKAVAVLTTLTLTSCDSLTTNQYEATALTTYTWQVKYADDLANEQVPRFETFATTSLLNRNGLKPEGAVTGPDDKGLWWPSLPPRPSVDEIEERKKSQEASSPELLKSVKYELKYKVGEDHRKLPTNYQVYREVVKAYPSQTSLQLTLGLNNDSVEKAEPVGSK